MSSRHHHSVDFAASSLLFLAPVAASGRDAFRSRSVSGAAKRRSHRRRGVAAIVEVVLSWHERARQRRALMALSDHMLSDIGLSRAEAHGEAMKPFWVA
jgi:uncharacterized protein YjiS (DUF1127 family)